MVAVYIFAALGILVTVLALIVLVITILPSVIAEFALFKWSIQQAIEIKKQNKQNKKNNNKAKDTVMVELPVVKNTEETETKIVPLSNTEETNDEDLL